MVNDLKTGRVILQKAIGERQEGCYRAGKAFLRKWHLSWDLKGEKEQARWCLREVGDLLEVPGWSWHWTLETASLPDILWVSSLFTMGRHPWLCQGQTVGRQGMRRVCMCWELLQSTGPVTLAWSVHSHPKAGEGPPEGQLSSPFVSVSFPPLGVSISWSAGMGVRHLP